VRREHFPNMPLMALDLLEPDGQRIAADLAAKGDALIDDFRPGVLEKCARADSAGWPM
jgi:crotonobetainyl-CoA:carnitine CoA-transferase CaiB-like acyl-CoA transferase